MADDWQHRIPADLVQQIRERKIILFAGAGLSRSLGLPLWSHLIDFMAEQLGFDPDVLNALSGDYPAIAEYYLLQKGNIRELRRWMMREWHVDDKKLHASAIHNKIIELDFPTIYTTNYDDIIEQTFKLTGKPHTVVTSVQDIACISANKTQIVKFHGNLADGDQIVLTESDYFERLEFEGPLDVKFRSDALGAGILFIGYSLKDVNLRVMLYKLQKSWKHAADQRPKSYIFLHRPDVIQEEVLRCRGVHPIVSDTDNPNDTLRCFFEELATQVRAA